MFIENGGMALNHVQVFSPYPSNILLEEGFNYNISFDIVSTIDRNVRVNLIEHSGEGDWNEDDIPWNSYGLDYNFNISADSLTSISKTFTANSGVTKPSTGEGNPNASLRFYLGGNELEEHNVTISNVSLSLISWGW